MPRLKSLVLTVGLVSLIASCRQASADDPPREAMQLMQTAVTAQNAGDWRLAIDHYRRLLEQFPDTRLSVKANYNLGVSLVQVREFEDAASALSQAVRHADRDPDFDFLSTAKLLLGFSHLRHGQQLARDPARSDDAGRRLQTAVSTFDELLRSDEQFADADQVLFFKGEALERLGELARAAEAYAEMLEQYPRGIFRADAKYALGAVLEQLGQLPQAQQQYQAFLDQHADHQAADEVRLRLGETLLQRAMVARQEGLEEAEGLLGAAASEFQTLADNRDYPQRDHALYQYATAMSLIDEHRRGAELFMRLIEQFPDSPLIGDARLAAGRQWIAAERPERAVEWLKPLADEPGPHRSSAAHLLAIALLRSERAEEAYELAQRVLQQAGDDPLAVELVLDQADAAAQIEQRRSEAIELYAQVAQRFPEHPRAPLALSQAVLRSLEAGDATRTIELADLFMENYATATQAPDVLAAQAEAHLALAQYDEAAVAFASLHDQFADHPQAGSWRLRSAIIDYHRQEFDRMVETLGELIPNLETSADRIEAHFFLGLAEYHRRNFDSAIEAFQQAAEHDPDGSRAPESLVWVGRAMAAANQADQAIDQFQMIADRYTDTEWAAQALYRKAEVLYHNQRPAEAAVAYRQARDAVDHESSIAPLAQFGLGLALIEDGQWSQAALELTQLLDRWPQAGVVQQALLARGMARRMAQQYDGAIEDLTAYLATRPDEEQRWGAMYEKALALAEAGRHDEAEQQYEALLSAAPQSPLADRWLYDLAWSQERAGRVDEARQSFARLAQEFPQSRLTTEAQFHIGQYHYEAGRFDRAIEAYMRVVDDEAASDELKERAIYKLGWSHFQQGDFGDALAAFRRQAEEFELGPLEADALFMISESLLRMGQYGEATEAYRTARPVIERAEGVSRNVQLLTLLHGAQAANKARDFELAEEFARAAVDHSQAEDIRPDALFELGLALKEQDRFDEAVQAWEQAANDFSAAGAKSRFMVGQVRFEQRDYDEAIKQFKLVLYGYGGLEAAAGVRQWQALAAYEAGRANYVRIRSTADAQRRAQLIAEARSMFGYLLEHYSDADGQASSGILRSARDALRTLDNL